ncbi:ExeM/NucH family extracellular endonuclease [Nocardioides panacisoli]|uniref:ExeM/NucH family extracellular endonuclease n=1 Tax=Nocardioides panacisoli TaxID=627624 RepID=UPI001C633EF4|nr:ExeM/NucH family extracellular endonuclease [Nocardioides panacisoli]QYJ05345.1 ExeM/NucH family extracellular endonuclease [Nocardioides panacisoli]
MAGPLAVPALAADPATDGLVLTEYVEGSSFNKAVEIYNGTGAAVDLADVEFRLYSNGRPLADGPTATHAFTGTLADGDTYVLANPRFNDDEGFTLAGEVDATSSAVNFNGNDAVVLADAASDAVLDSIGQVGDDTSFAADVTLRRTDLTRDTAPEDAFTLDAFTSHPADTVDQLGAYPDGGGDPDPEPEPATCDTSDGDLTRISAIQGSGADPSQRYDSPLDGETHTVRAVVTMGDTDLDGYFVQEEPADHDDDPTSSEGLFVFQPDGELPEAGSTVELTGRVTAYFGLTQLSSPETAVCDVAPTSIDPTPLALPLDDAGREALESMLVTTSQDLAVSGLFAAYAFGELGLAHPDVLEQPTSAFAPDDPAATALLEQNAASFLKVNDRQEAPGSYDPYPWERFDEDLSAGDTMRAGSVTGALGYSFDEFKVEPLPDRDFPESEDTSPVPAAPELRKGNDVVSFNVLNYFNTFGDSEVLRGAQNEAQFRRQTDKIVAAITEMDAAVYGLIEIENDYEDLYDGDPTTVPSAQTLVDELNAVAGAGTYDWIKPRERDLTTEGLGGGGLGTDAIAQALIYQPDRARPMGPAATFDIDSELSGDAENNRWPLAQTFKVDRQKVTVVVNHLKSKGSTCTDTAGPDFALGEDVETALTGNCNLTRTHAARRLVDWVQDGPTRPRAKDTLLLGDFNSYEEEDPIEVLVDAGFTDLVQEQGDDAFTYKFDGRYGRLDYAFASPSLARRVADAEVWQVNSRAPVGHLYYNDPVDSSAQASSDHDPVLVSLDRRGHGHHQGNGKGHRKGHGDERRGGPTRAGGR